MHIITSVLLYPNIENYVHKRIYLANKLQLFSTTNQDYNLYISSRFLLMSKVVVNRLYKQITKLE